MTTFNSENMYDGYIQKLKEDYGFKQVLFTRNTRDFIFFECLKDGAIIEIRFNISDQWFEVCLSPTRWEPI